MSLTSKTQEIKVRKSDLLKALYSNREKHIREYCISLEGYYVDLADDLAKYAEEAKNRKFTKGISYSKTPPECYKDNYDVAIAMLEMSVDTELTIDRETFNQYVLDNWSWKKTFSTLNAKYLGGQG